MWRGFALWKNHGKDFNFQLRGERCAVLDVIAYQAVQFLLFQQECWVCMTAHLTTSTETLPFLWDGRAKDLKAQIHPSITQTPYRRTYKSTVQPLFPNVLNYRRWMGGWMFLHTLGCWGWSSRFQWTEFVSVAAPQSHHSQNHENDQRKDQQHGQKVA